MRINTKALPFALAFAAQRSAKSFARITRCRSNESPLFVRPIDSEPAWAQASQPPSIYIVDDMPPLIWLYLALLEPTGCCIRAFNDREEALAALKLEAARPLLLITDYLGRGMTADEFMQACRAIHPGLRILLASGFNPEEMTLLRARPDRFLQKPFSPDEFQREVRAALAESGNPSAS